MSVRLYFSFHEQLETEWLKLETHGDLMTFGANLMSIHFKSPFIYITTDWLTNIFIFIYSYLYLLYLYLITYTYPYLQLFSNLHTYTYF